MKTPNTQGSFSPVLLLGSLTGMPVSVDRIDGVATGLNAIGKGIIDAGFDGVRGIVLSEKEILWQCRLDTPEGVYFAGLYQGAEHGKSLPSPEQVLEIIRPFLVSSERRQP